MSTLLDTNILVRLVRPDDARHVSSRDAVRLLLEQGEELCVVPQNLYEFWVVATRPAEDNGIGLSAVQARRELERVTEVFTLLRDERGILARWQQLVVLHEVKGKTAHDARLVAAIERHGVDRLLTLNPDHFARFTDVAILTPEGVLQSAG